MTHTKQSAQAGPCHGQTVGTATALWVGPPRATAKTPLLELCHTSIHTSIHTILNSAGEKSGKNRCTGAPRTP